ncbi:MAG: hypothetical protein ACOYBT_10280 [Polynucleobacter sp.]
MQMCRDRGDEGSPERQFPEAHLHDGDTAGTSAQHAAQGVFAEEPAAEEPATAEPAAEEPATTEPAPAEPAPAEPSSPAAAQQVPVSPAPKRTPKQVKAPTSTSKKLYGITVDFKTHMDDGEIAHKLFDTSVISPEYPRNKHVSISAQHMSVPAYTPVQGAGMAVGSVQYVFQPLVETEFTKLGEFEAPFAKLMAMYYSTEDTNQQLMEQHHNQLMLLYQQEYDRLAAIHQQYISEADSAKKKAIKARQEAMSAIRAAREACLEHRAASRRVRQSQEQLETAEDTLIHKRKEDFNEKEEHQAKKAKDLSQYEATSGYEEARAVVVAGMVARSAILTPRWWSRNT